MAVQAGAPAYWDSSHPLSPLFCFLSRGKYRTFSGRIRRAGHPVRDDGSSGGGTVCGDKRRPVVTVSDLTLSLPVFGVFSRWPGHASPPPPTQFRYWRAIAVRAPCERCPCRPVCPPKKGEKGRGLSHCRLHTTVLFVMWGFFSVRVHGLPPWWTCEREP